MNKIFISYAREDLPVAEKLYSDLQKNGLNPWLDTKDLLPGARWKHAIKQAIEESAFFIALLSENSVNKRGYVQREFRQALEVLDEFPQEAVFLIPVRLDNCSPRLAALELESLNWVDLFPSYEEGFERILRAVRRKGAPTVERPRPEITPPSSGENTHRIDFSYKFWRRMAVLYFLLPLSVTLPLLSIAYYFNDSSFRTQGPGAIAARRVLIDSYHGWPSLTVTHESFLRSKGFEFDTLHNLHSELSEGRITDNFLSTYDCYILDLPYYNYKDGNVELTDTEIDSIKRYVHNGGGAFLSGLGWAWVQYGNLSIEKNPLNLIAKEYGIFFDADFMVDTATNESPIFGPPFMKSDHPLVRGIESLSIKTAINSSLIVTKPAIPIIWGNDNIRLKDRRAENPVLLAAARANRGRIVFLQQGAYAYPADLSQSPDSRQLLENILNWLTHKT